jgi:hypothetical protein
VWIKEIRMLKTFAASVITLSDADSAAIEVLLGSPGELDDLWLSAFDRLREGISGLFQLTPFRIPIAEAEPSAAWHLTAARLDYLVVQRVRLVLAIGVGKDPREAPQATIEDRTPWDRRRSGGRSPIGMVRW